MINRYSGRGVLRYGLPIGFLLLVSVLSSCLKEVLDNCPDTFPVQVTLADLAGHDPIDPADVKSVKLYIFDQNELLLEVRETQLNKTEHIPCSGKDVLLVAVANAAEGQRLNEPHYGEHRDRGRLELKQNGTYGSIRVSAFPDDLLWGEIRVATETIVRSATTGEVGHLSLRRKTGAIYVRLYGLHRYAEQLNLTGDFSVVLEAEHDQLDFSGAPGRTTYAGDDPVHYKPELKTPAMVPIKDLIESVAENRLNVMTSDEGDPIALDLYIGSRHLGNYRATLAGEPLRVANGQLTLIEFYFGEYGLFDIRLTPARWGDIPPIDKDF